MSVFAINSSNVEGSLEFTVIITDVNILKTTTFTSLHKFGGGSWDE